MAIRKNSGFRSRVSPDANVLVVVTEGATDRAAYDHILASVTGD